MCKHCDPAKQGRNKAIKSIQESIQYNVLSITSVKPYTHVVIEATLDSVTYHIDSFSKCNAIDWWKEQRGAQIAVGRGLKRLAKGVLDGVLPDGINRHREPPTAAEIKQVKPSNEIIGVRISTTGTDGVAVVNS